MPAKKERISLYLDKGQILALRKISAKTGVPYGVLIRRAVDRYLKGEKQ
jgi:hypothetical protein